MKLTAAAMALGLFFACGTTKQSKDLSAADVRVVYMRDNHFEPDRISVRSGQTIKFKFINRGRNEHEAFIGGSSEQREHESAMKEGTEMSGHDMHDGSMTDGLTLKPGASGELSHTFSDAGTVLIGCHEPGHYGGGMVARITVRD